MSRKKYLGVIAALVGAALSGLALSQEPADSARVEDGPAGGAPQGEQPASSDHAAVAQPEPCEGLAAMQAASKAGKYLFVLFRKDDDEQTQKMRETVAAAIQRAEDRAVSAEVDMASEAEQPIIDRFGLRWAPLPLTLAIAPNGVVTAGFPTRVDVEELLDAFVSPATENLLKALGEGKLVFLAVQNHKSEAWKAAMRGVRQFKQDPRFAADTEIIKVNPADQREAQLLDDLQIDPDSKQAITVFFGPRGRRIGQYVGETKLDDLVYALQASLSGFG